MHRGISLAALFVAIVTVSSQTVTPSESAAKDAFDRSVYIQSVNEANYSIIEVDLLMSESKESCLEHLGPKGIPPPGDEQAYCNGWFDDILCWPAVPGGTIVKQLCPPLTGLIHDNFGFRVCNADGQWEGNKELDVAQPNGWTNYTLCYKKETYELYEKFFGSESSDRFKQIAKAARIMKAVGLFISLLSLSLSIFIFCYYRSLRCDRTRMHRNLFVAILIHVVISLVKLVDDFIERTGAHAVGGASVGRVAISTTPILCECFYTLIEYTNTVKFMWMFIEGMYLHNMLVVSVFSGKPNYILYYVLGWAFPLVLTVAWATTTGLLLVSGDDERCWYAYHFKLYYWILEGPRAAIIAINLFFLLNIIRVLITKLRENHSNEAQQVRKAVKAAIVLLPLLGITHFLQMVYPVSGSIGFALWSFVSHFFVDFQGFFISLIYCFLNGEVQSTLHRAWIQSWKDRQRNNQQKNRTRSPQTGYFSLRFKTRSERNGSDTCKDEADTLQVMPPEEMNGAEDKKQHAEDTYV